MTIKHSNADAPVVNLEPMSASEHALFIEHSITGYAMDLIRTYRHDPAHATACATDSVTALLPEGLATPGHRFFNIVSDTKDRVGHLWFEIRSEDGESDTLFICDLEIHSTFRRQGWARSALRAAEKWALARGIRRMELNVFANNEPALALYRTHAFMPCEITMGKYLE